MDQDQIQTYLQKSLVSVRKAAAFIHEQAGNLDSIVIEEKSHNSFVSKVDKEAEQILVKDFKALIPEAGFVTEENTVSNKRKEWTWILDPLDGTTNFLKGIPHYSVSVALYHNDVPKMGIVADVERNEIYYATEGGGAFCNGIPIHVSKTKKLQHSIISTGFPYEDSKRTEALISTFIAFIHKARGMRRFGSAALDLCFVARGWYDAYYETCLNPWDVAAGLLIVKEAGGNNSDFKNGNQYQNGEEIVSSNTKIHQELLQILSEHLNS